MGRPRTPLRDRLLAQIEVDDEGCWLRTAVPLSNGYTLAALGDGSKKQVGAHRLAYELFIGPIPEGLTVDHLCHDPERCKGGPTCKHRRCINPEHLGLATYRDNAFRGHSPAGENARKTHCKRGHPFDDANTYISARGHRACRACKLLWFHAHKPAPIMEVA